MPATSSVKIENNDSKIWHRDRVILDLTDAMYQDHDLLVDLNGEGPCATSLGLYAMLDNLCDRYRYSKNRIRIYTCNLIEKHDEYIIVPCAPTKHIDKLQNMLGQESIPIKNIDSTTKYFGNFIGHSSRARLAIASYLYSNHRDKCFQTFHTTPTNEKHREFIGLEDMWLNNYKITHIENAVDFLKQTPMKYDPVDDGPILHMKMYGILGAYSDVFLDMVCNTYISGRTFYMDEKLWRPIITKTPFLIHGPRNFIKNLRQLGFKTFDRWWDEGFSEDPPDYQVQEIIDILDNIAAWDLTTMSRIYNEMKPVLDHNYKTFMNLTAQDFKQAFEYV
jgi:hypothetical protein